MRRKLLLLARDPERLLAVAEVVHRRLDIDVDLAKSSEAALDLIADQHYDLVVCGVVQTEVDTTDLLKAVRNRWPQTVVCLLAGRDLTLGEHALTDAAGSFSQEALELNVLIQGVVRALHQGTVLSTAGHVRSKLLARLKQLMR